MRALTPDQRAAQLFMVAAYSNRTRVDEDSISALIQQYGIGGLIFFQGGPGRQARLLNRYQSQARVPLLVAMDGEWGVGMRLDSVGKFPYQMSLGGAADTALLYDMGREVARQFTRLGMHVNFAPVAARLAGAAALPQPDCGRAGRHDGGPPQRAGPGYRAGPQHLVAAHPPPGAARWCCAKATATRPTRALPAMKN